MGIPDGDNMTIITVLTILAIFAAIVVGGVSIRTLIKSRRGVKAKKEELIKIFQAQLSSKEKMINNLSERIDGLEQNIAFDKSLISDLKEKARIDEIGRCVAGQTVAQAIMLLKVTKIKQPIKELGQVKVLLKELHKYIIFEEITRNSQLHIAHEQIETGIFNFIPTESSQG
jgi:ABC-type multidrug transport system fused ATPase/permease subunit